MRRIGKKLARILLRYSLQIFIRWRIRRNFPSSDFKGSFEKAGNLLGMRQEQWLWEHRDLIKGDVLDMSSPKSDHEFIYELPNVKRVWVSDYARTEIGTPPNVTPVDITGDVAAVPSILPQEAFDTALCLSILEHCADPVQMLRNLRTSLRPGGTLFVWTPFAYTDGHTGSAFPDYWRFTRQGLQLIAERSGLTVRDCGYFNDLSLYMRLATGHVVSVPKGSWGVPVSNWMICVNAANSV